MQNNGEIAKHLAEAKRWLQVNAVGVLLYLLAASQTWGGGNHYGQGAGDPFVWMFFAFPILVLFLIIDIVWFIKSIQKIFHNNHAWQQLVICVLAGAVWLTACCFDWLMC